MTVTSGKLRKLFAPMDMTEGNSFRQILRFSVPLLIGNFAQQMYSAVDAIVVGNSIGDSALGAVGLSFSPIMLIFALFMGISTGAGITVSQYFGARNRLMLNKAVGTILVLAFWAGAACTVLGVSIARPLLKLLGSPPEMLDMAATYLTIYFGGVIALVYFNILSGVLRGMGDSVSPLLYLLLASALNIGLDILFVTQLGMKTEGVALATVISQSIAALLTYQKLRCMTDVVDLKRENLKLDREITRKIVKLGLPLGAMQMVGSMQAVLVQALVNSMGSMVVSTIAAVMRVDGFIMMTNFSLAAAATTFTAQNYGARKFTRIRKGHRDTLKIALAAMLILVSCIVLFGRQLMGLFTATDAVAVAGARFFRLLALGYVSFAVLQTFVGVMNGMSQTTIPMAMSIIATLGIRLPLAYLIAHNMRSAIWPNGNPDAIFISLLIAWTINAAVTGLIYHFGRWRKRAETKLLSEGV